jgi:hypothetical protein
MTRNLCSATRYVSPVWPSQATNHPGKSCLVLRTLVSRTRTVDLEPSHSRRGLGDKDFGELGKHSNSRANFRGPPTGAAGAGALAQPTARDFEKVPRSKFL